VIDLSLNFNFVIIALAPSKSRVASAAATREYHGFVNPHGFNQRVPGGVGAGVLSLTLHKPIPINRVWQVAHGLGSKMIKNSFSAGTEVNNPTSSQ
jgi:hypothetical protein